MRPERRPGAGIPGGRVSIRSPHVRSCVPYEAAAVLVRQLRGPVLEDMAVMQQSIEHRAETPTGFQADR